MSNAELEKLVDEFAFAIMSNHANCPCHKCELAREAIARTKAALLAAFEAVRRENERLKERRFPIQGGPSIPWSLIGPHDGQAFLNHGQSLETLANRGGLSPTEAWCVLNDKPLKDFKDISVENARQYLVNLNRKFEELRELKKLQHANAALAERVRELQSAVNDMVRAFEILEPIEILDSIVLNRLKALKTPEATGRLNQTSVAPGTAVFPVEKSDK